ncbi:PTS sugar transporter subunit IIA [Sebaldella sp. S0638]|uniref:PTS sugar transporter subunit IIA n=1 Tax=Sebaldella sp. S0638 TaxID=2957809 RepID=UPI00209E8BC3|nr:PTS sugar transporter subunit IIA [Sebaldella sp. S0638]MCP1223477.1 PTS sugar transporter subunit IIA [Sebaldella sp. S0638]
MLKEFLNGNINLTESASDWEESVRIAAKPLLEKGFISEDYVNSMTNDIKRLGFYIVLREGVAMPHSRPENGVSRTSMSLLKLENPVNYGDNKVKLIFILAAEDSEKHIEALTGFSELLQDDDEVEALMNAKTMEEVTNIINKY